MIRIYYSDHIGTLLLRLLFEQANLLLEIGDQLLLLRLLSLQLLQLLFEIATFHCALKMLLLVLLLLVSFLPLKTIKLLLKTLDLILLLSKLCLIVPVRRLALEVNYHFLERLHLELYLSDDVH